VADLANLVAKSLVGFDVTASRWSLLETIRAYALEKLAETGEAAATAQRHAEFFRDLLVPAETSLPLQPAIEDMVRYGREIDNIRAALDWSFSSKGAPAIGVVLTAAYAPVWLHLSLLVECRERAERAFAVLTPEIELSPLLRLRLHVGLGVALILTMGPVERTRSLLATAREIAAGLDANSQLRTHWAQWSIDVVSGNSRAALSTAEQFSRIARRIGNPADILVGERLTGSALQYTGRQNEARECFERVLESYAPPASQHHTLLFQYDQSALARAMLARVLWLQGLVDQAVDHARKSVEEAQASDMGLTLCWALHYAMCPIATMTGDLAGAERAVAQLIDCARTFNAPFWRMFGKCLQGKLAILWGEPAAGVALLREGLATCNETGWRLCYPEFKGTLAAGLAGLGELDEALYLVKEALARATDGGECWYAPELLRIQGAILLQQGTEQSLAAAEDCFHGGLMIARDQGALFWELRLALSLAQLMVHQNRQEDARNILAPVYARFSEGFTIADMRTARALLEALPSA